MNKNFFNDFQTWLYGYNYYKKGVCTSYTTNTIINTIKVIKNFLRQAYEASLTDNDIYLKVRASLPSNLSEKIYLNEKDLKKLRAVDTETPKERVVLDMFIIASYTALRISDIKRLGQAEINEDYITMYQKKTKDIVNIPILNEVSQLIKKYHRSSEGFPSMDNSYANRTIKKLAFRCGMTENISYKEERGGKVMIHTMPKYSLISFHTARRSCITNLYKRGYNVNYIMTLSGHKSIQAFQRYIRTSNNEMSMEFLKMLRKNGAVPMT